MIRWDYYVALVASAAASGVHTQNATIIPEIALGTPPFSEQVDKTILAEGGLLMGVAMGGLDRGVSEPALTVSGLRATDKTICVAIKHANAAYTAGFRTPNAGRSGTVRFRLPSRVIGKLNARAGAVAILAQASAGAACVRSDPVLPAAWGRVMPTSEGFALVNDHQADISRARIGPQPMQRCQSATSLAGAGVPLRSFQVSCSLRWSAGSCASEAPLVIQFVDAGDQSEVRATLRRPC